MAGNQDKRVETPIELTTGPLPGEKLLESFKFAIAKENVFQIMFGLAGERIFVSERPDLNETILPAMILSWKNDNFKTNNNYLDGAVDCLLCLPTRLSGNYNALRRVASMIQRWMGGSMNLWAQNPGLTKFGYDAEYDYSGDLTSLSGFQCPVIQITFPFRFDLQLMRLQVPGFDPNRPLDSSDVGFLESIQLNVIKTDDNSILQEVLVETGETNPTLSQ
jgi:hypothetical protein